MSVQGGSMNTTKRFEGRLSLSRVKLKTQLVSDEIIAKKYLNKITDAEKRGIEFNLPLTSYINIFKAKRCHYTGIPLTHNTITIDRIDASKGYVKGNVVACHSTFNSFKSVVEDNKNPLTFKNCLKGLTKTNKLMED